MKRALEFVTGVLKKLFNFIFHPKKWVLDDGRLMMDVMLLQKAENVCSHGRVVHT